MSKRKLWPLKPQVKKQFKDTILKPSMLGPGLSDYQAGVLPTRLQREFLDVQVKQPTG